MNNGGGNLAAPQDGVQAFLHSAAHGLWGDTVLLVILHLLGPTIFGDGDKRLHAFRHLIGEEHDLSIDVARRAPRCLNQRGLATQKTLFVGIENADERDLGKIEAFTEQIDPDENVEVSGAEPAQNFHALDRVDITVQIAHL